MKKGESGNRLDYAGARALLIAILEQAVTDFKDLVAAGRIVDGKVMPATGPAIRDYARNSDVQALVDFFNSSVMDEWIYQGRIRINPNLIREKLGLKPQNYDIYRP
ncbi:MAG TPA: hypothetical protein VGY98_14830 [Verrucomicrobiae bacterium]|jgi:hypothetical protein|nr:hypothetical protein [Verrucomicrobiae bacterium]